MGMQMRRRRRNCTDRSKTADGPREFIVSKPTRSQTHEETARDVVARNLNAVPVPFVSPRWLGRMQAFTHRENDADDLVFAQRWFASRSREALRF